MFDITAYQTSYPDRVGQGSIAGGDVSVRLEGQIVQHGTDQVTDQFAAHQVIQHSDHRLHVAVVYIVIRGVFVGDIPGPVHCQPVLRNRDVRQFQYQFPGLYAALVMKCRTGRGCLVAAERIAAGTCCQRDAGDSRFFIVR